MIDVQAGIIKKTIESNEFKAQAAIPDAALLHFQQTA
jgi:hypothetical protein